MELKSNLCLTKDVDMSLKPATTCRPLFPHKNAIAWYDSQISIPYASLLHDTGQRCLPTRTLGLFSARPGTDRLELVTFQNSNTKQRSWEGCSLVEMIMFTQSGVHHIVPFYILPVVKSQLIEKNGVLKNLLHLIFFNPEQMIEVLAIRPTVKNLRDKGILDLAGDLCYRVCTREDISQAIRNGSFGKRADIWDNGGGGRFYTLNNFEHGNAVGPWTRNIGRFRL